MENGVLIKISQNSQENTSVRESFLINYLFKKRVYFHKIGYIIDAQKGSF